MACATMVTTADLARMAAVLARGGADPVTGEQLVEPEVVQRVLTVMIMCGMYDDAGRWMARVGLPGKSGVGVRAMRFCEHASPDLDLHLMRQRQPR